MQLGCAPRRLLAVGVALGLGVAAAGCGSSGHGSAVPTTLVSAPTGSPASSGSGCGRGASSGSSTLHLAVGGANRLVIVHIPSGYEGSMPVALVLNLHGSESTASAQELFSGMDATSDADGFIVAYPQALIPAGSGYEWNIPGVPLFGGTYPPKNAANDITFIVDLVHDLAGRYCINSHEVYATGVSGGGRMASQLACDASGTIAAVAPVAGLRLPSPCPTTRPVAVISFHGTADPIDPYDGNGQAYWTYSVPTAARLWAGEDGCSSTPATTSGTGYTLTAYRGCKGGVTVELYSLDGEGHEWPGGPKMPVAITDELGPQTSVVDANSTMWAFFQAHPA
jgi:polyhydroxybutyrate depolymerase